MAARVALVALLVLASILVAVEELALPPDPPAPEAFVVDCEGVATVPSPEGGWEAVAPLIEGPGPVRSISAALAPNTDGDDVLMVRVELDAGIDPERRPLIFLDTDGDRLHGVWSYETPVSASAWDLHVDAEGDVWSHRGLPDQWDWQHHSNPSGYAWHHDGRATFVCLPASLVGDDPAKVRFAAEIDNAWLPATFLGGVSIADSQPGIAVAAPAGPSAAAVDPLMSRVRMAPPGRLAFAYQWAPWAVRGCPISTDDMSCAVDAYRSFAHVVFGGGIEDPLHPSHSRTRRLITNLQSEDPDREIWGYVSMRRHAGVWHDNREVLRRAALWHDMGVTGIFLDEFDLCEPGWRTCPRADDDSEIVVGRQRQREAVEAIHGLGLAVFANAHSIHGALGDVRGDPTPLGRGTSERPADMYLLENPTMHAGQWWSGLDRLAGASRFRDAPEYAAATGVRIAVVDTAAGPVADGDVEDPGYQASWWRAVIAGADAHAYTNPVYSASGEMSDNLPALGLPPGSETVVDRRLAFVGSVTIERDGEVAWRRVVDAGGTLVGRLIVNVDDDGTVTGSLELDR